MAKQKKIIVEVFNRFIRHDKKLYKAGDLATTMNEKVRESLLENPINSDLFCDLVLKEGEELEAADKKA